MYYLLLCHNPWKVENGKKCRLDPFDTAQSILSNWRKIWCEEAELHLETFMWPKWQISKIENDGRPPFWWLYLYLSRESFDYDEIWCAQFDSENCHVSDFRVIKLFHISSYLQWVKQCPSHFMHKLTALLMPLDQIFTCNGHDPDDMKYRNVNNKTANINVQNCSLYTLLTATCRKWQT